MLPLTGIEPSILGLFVVLTLLYIKLKSIEYDYIRITRLSLSNNGN